MLPTSLLALPVLSVSLFVSASFSQAGTAPGGDSPAFTDVLASFHR
jgi:hypothetical protein